jgi:hypothetical protein
MIKGQTSYKIRQYIDLILPAVFIFFAVLWLLQSVYTIILTQSFFSPMWLLIVGFPMHVTTALNLTVLYLVNFFFFRTFLPGHERVVRALLFTTIGVFFYDLMWSICCIIINGYGSFLIPLVSTSVIIAYMLIMNKRVRILKWNKKLIILAFAMYSITLAIFIFSGFFQQMALWDQGVVMPDPNGWEWALNKTVTSWMWMSIALR